MQDDGIAHQQAQVPAPAPDTPARHGGSSAAECRCSRCGWTHDAQMPCDHGTVSVAPYPVEGHGQDPAQDWAQTASLIRAAAPRLRERLAAEALAADSVRVAPAGAQAAGGASQRETPASDGAIYWLDIDHDLRVVLDGCPVIIRRPGGTVVQIDPSATPAQRAELITRHVEAIEVSK